jgi:protein-tyrosine-phosphatase
VRVLYFCIENASRSQIAEALTTLLSADGVEAYSAGSEPAGAIDPSAVEVMRELGYDMSGQVPKSLDELPEVEFDYVITLGCGDERPMVKARMHIDWDIPDSSNMRTGELRSVRDMLRERVERLLVAPRLAAD